jgi:hypothetical protein
MATETEGMQSDDFNVMTGRDLPKPAVILAQNDRLEAGGTLAVYALGPCQANGISLARDDLILTDAAVILKGDWPVISVRLKGLPHP